EGGPQPEGIKSREANKDTAFDEELAVCFESASSKRPGERGDEPQGHRNQSDREEVCGRLPNPGASSQGREEPVVQEERDAEHDGESENVRLARAVHGPPAQPEHHLVLPEAGPLPRTRTTNVIFDRSGEGLTHGPIPADVRMETIRGSPQAVRIPGIRDRGVGIAKQDPEDRRQVLTLRIEAENVPGRASLSHVVWEDGSSDGPDDGTAE